MENKENCDKSSLKRRNSFYNDVITEPKRSLHETVTEKIVESERNNPIEIKSSCLTDNFKTTCKMHEIDDQLPLISTPENQILPLSEFYKLTVPQIGDELMNNDSIHRALTPREQILSLAEFKKLPKPVITPSDGKPIKSVCLNKSQSDLQGLHSSCALDDSFEVLKYSLNKTQTMTPRMARFSATFNTPETPSDINSVDLDASNSCIPQLAHVTNFIPLRRAKYAELAAVSPMFYADPVAKPVKKETTQRPLRDVDEIERPFSEPELIDEIKVEHLTADQVGQIIDQEFIGHYSDDSYVHHIIDCRYPYEFQGGHLSGAVNLYTPFQMLNYIFLCNFDEELLYKPLNDVRQELNTLLQQICSLKKVKNKHRAFIFHCEFSSVRGPEMAECMRNVDRLANLANYPSLFFPKVFVMKKGYKDFYRKFKRHCEPQKYVRMCSMAISDKKPGNEFDLDNSIDDSDNDESLDQQTIEQRIRQYNDCKLEVQEQMKVLSLLMKMLTQ